MHAQCKYNTQQEAKRCYVLQMNVKTYGAIRVWCVLQIMSYNSDEEEDTEK